jgi:hypothetical protein
MEKNNAAAIPPLTAPAPLTDLHNAIMNIPCKRADHEFMNAEHRMLYKNGHRDARHAAAELALSVEAGPAPQQSELTYVGTLSVFEDKDATFGHGYDISTNMAGHKALQSFDGYELFATKPGPEVAKAAPAAPVQEPESRSRDVVSAAQEFLGVLDKSLGPVVSFSKDAPLIAQLRAALAGCSEGWQMVPKVMTYPMICAMHRAQDAGCNDTGIWAMVLEAAPSHTSNACQAAPVQAEQAKADISDKQIRDTLGDYGALPLKDGAPERIIEGREQVLILAIRAILSKIYAANRLRDVRGLALDALGKIDAAPALPAQAEQVAAAPVQAVTEQAEPPHEEGDFYAVARARGFSDFGLTISGNYSDPMLQALREKFDALKAIDQAATSNDTSALGDTGGAK